MAAQYKGVPEGAVAVIPRLVCRDVEAEIDFCCEALGAVEAHRRPGPRWASSVCDVEIRTCHAHARS